MKKPIRIFFVATTVCFCSISFGMNKKRQLATAQEKKVAMDYLSRQRAGLKFMQDLDQRTKERNAKAAEFSAFLNTTRTRKKAKKSCVELVSLMAEQHKESLEEFEDLLQGTGLQGSFQELKKHLRAFLFMQTGAYFTASRIGIPLDELKEASGKKEE